MARGGIANMVGFGRMRCDRHRLGDAQCEQIIARMAQMDAHFTTVSTSVDAMRAELTRPTEQLRMATSAG
eukprot:COSAG01_NODE_11029_length_2023_cov_121.533784_2_plen_70_part_00